MKTFAIATAAIGLAVTAAPAFAGPSDLRVETVSIDGLNLASPAGQKMLDERIERAARSVCEGDESRTGTRIKRAKHQDCIIKARASAKRQVASMINDRLLGG